MVNKKTQNSVLILTTLGVYLGLLVVGGAAPQVFAHSATTRNFEITDEIEVKDDLDNKPEDERSTTTESLTTYLQDLERFVNTLKRLGSSGNFDPKNDSFDVVQTTQLPCVPANKTGSYTANAFVTKNESLRPWLESYSKLLTDGYSLGDCLPNNRFAPEEATDSRFNLRLDKEALVVEIQVKKSSPAAAKLIADDLAVTSARIRAKAAGDAVRLKLIEATAFRHKGDHILVVTRLPRAALDPLLAKDAK